MSWRRFGLPLSECSSIHRGTAGRLWCWGTSLVADRSLPCQAVPGNPGTYCFTSPAEVVVRLNKQSRITL